MKRIGEILIERDVLNKNDLNQGLIIQKEKGGLLGEILLRQKSLLEIDFLQGLADQLDMDFMARLPREFDTKFTEKVLIHFLRKYHLVPLIDGSNPPRIAINDPLNFQPLDDLCHILHWDSPKIVIASKSSIMAAISAAYDVNRDSAAEVISDMHEEEGDQIISAIEEIGDLLDDTSDAPIIKLVNLIFSQAVRSGASDIHIEPYQRLLKIRHRVDGVLYDMFTPPHHIQAALVSRIKIMAKLNIAEKRLPQDGRIEIKIAEKSIDIRVATLPTTFGERVVLRLLDKSNAILSMPDLGMPQDHMDKFNGLIHRPHGILLVTGPTGSGKTTTLYAALATINNTDVNIITIEDPVEYQIEGIGQVQVNQKIDLTFANGLRSIVRQDPDVILIGEIRDIETAKIAIQSALTGHLVFSTLHTNDSASAITRLTDMGIESFMVTSSVNAILAQRLVRLLCHECREFYTPETEAISSIGITPEMLAGHKIGREVGCPICQHTGYHGRNGIFELLQFNDDIKSTVLQTSDANLIQAKSIEQGMRTLRQDGCRQVLAGNTSIEEVFRVTEQQG